MLRFLDAGESHGKMLTAIIEGFPANVPVDIENINLELQKRQGGFGRGLRMKIEKDKVEIVSGVRGGRTTGSPICLLIHNRDYENWSKVMDVKNEWNEKITVPRPGHADLNGVLKYNLNDIRNVIERASARETAIRTAVGAFCMELLKIFNVKIVNRTLVIKNIYDDSQPDLEMSENIEKIYASSLYCFDDTVEEKMVSAINDAANEGDTLGGCCEVIAFNVPPGLGSYSFYDRKADFLMSGAVMSIQGVKNVEIGNGIRASKLKGSQVNDEIIIDNGMYLRKSNSSGGIEGGMTNGMPIVIRAFMKPIPTIKKEIKTVDLGGNSVVSRYERSDVCAVPALGVVCRNVTAYEITKMFLEKFAGDSVEDITCGYKHYINRIGRG